MYEIYIFFPSHCTFHRKIPDSKLNCISKNLSFPYFPLWFITALDRRTSRPFSFQFKTIPNRVSHEFLQNGARLGSKWRAVLDFSMVKHGCYKHVVLSVPSDIAFSVFHDSYASLSLLAARKKGKSWNGAVFTGRLVTLGESRQLPGRQATAGRHFSPRYPPSMVLLERLSRRVHPLFHGLTLGGATDGYRKREGGRKFGCKLETSASTVNSIYIYIFSIDDERRVRRAY